LLPGWKTFTEPSIKALIELFCAQEDLATYDPYDVWKTPLGFRVKDLYNRRTMTACLRKNAVSGFSINPTVLCLNCWLRFPGAAAPAKRKRFRLVAPHCDQFGGRFLLAANTGRNFDVSSFFREPNHGILTPVAGSPLPLAGNSSSGISLETPDGRLSYTSDSTLPVRLTADGKYLSVTIGFFRS
jgi:hypothetical protein